MFLMQKSEFVDQLLEENELFSFAAPYDFQCFLSGAHQISQALLRPYPRLQIHFPDTRSK